MMPDPISVENGALVGTTLMGLMLARRYFPWIFESHWGERLLPVLPAIIAVAAAQLGMGGAHGTWIDKLKMGIMAGFAASSIYKVGKTTVAGKGLTNAAEPAADDSKGT